MAACVLAAVLVRSGLADQRAERRSAWRRQGARSRSHSGSPRSCCRSSSGRRRVRARRRRLRERLLRLDRLLRRLPGRRAVLARDRARDLDPLPGWAAASGPSRRARLPATRIERATTSATRSRSSGPGSRRCPSTGASSPASACSPGSSSISLAIEVGSAVVPIMTSLGSWNVEPPLLLLRLCGLPVLARRPAAGLGAAHRTGAPRARMALLLGLATIVIALDSPLDSLSSQLFAAHMTQHVLLLTVAPPLIVLSAPWSRLWQPLPLDFRRSAARDGRARARAGLRCAPRPAPSPVRSPPGCCSTPISSLWHVPALYDATLSSAAVHDLEHALFFFTGTPVLGAGVRLAAVPRLARLAPARRVRDRRAPRRLGARDRPGARPFAALLRLLVVWRTGRAGSPRSATSRSRRA